jgi:L-malate glycosyltransferase
MKILFLTGSFFPKIGGVEKSVFFVSRELFQKGYDVDIVTQQFDKANPVMEHFSEGFNVYRIPPSMIPKTGTLRKWLWLLKHIKLIWNADIIHFHDFDVMIKWFFPFRFIFLRKKYYITFHGYEGFPVKFKYIFFRKLAHQLTDGNICVGEYIKRWYRTKPDIVYYGAAEINGNDLTECRQEDIVFLGRLEKDTEIMNYLEALKIFYSNVSIKPVFKIVGDGSLKKDVLEFLDKNNIPYQFCGLQENPNQYIKNAKIVLTSSYLSIFESLICGKIALAFYSNNLKRDYLKCFPNSDALFLITEDTHTAAKKIEDVCVNPEKFDEMSFAGRIYASEQTWSKVADKYISLYKKTGNDEN